MLQRDSFVRTFVTIGMWILANALSAQLLPSSSELPVFRSEPSGKPLLKLKEQPPLFSTDPDDSLRWFRPEQSGTLSPIPDLKLDLSDPYEALNLENDLLSYRKLNAFSTLGFYRNYDVYQGLGDLYTAGAMLQQRINGFLTLTGGLSVSRYSIDLNQYTTAGLSGDATVQLSDRFRLHVNGYWDLNTPASDRPFLYNMYPQTHYGGSLEYKVTNDWGVLMGAQREFDVFRRKWITVPYVMPIFYSK